LLKQNGLGILFRRMGSNITQHVPHKVPAKIYEVIAKKI
jgi:hypothetical protein